MPNKLDGAGTGSYPNKFVNRICAGTITANDVVMEDWSQTGTTRVAKVLEAAALALGQPKAMGIAMQSGVTGDVIQVQVEGVHLTADTATGVLIDVPLVVDATAGRLQANVAANIVPIFAISMGTEAANVCVVRLLNPLGIKD